MTNPTNPGGHVQTATPSATDIYISSLEAMRRQLEIVNATLRAKVAELEARVKAYEEQPAEAEEAKD